MKRTLALAGVMGSILVATGCGSQRPSEAAFRAQANRICHHVHQQNRAADFSSRSGFAKGLAAMRAGVEQLARIHPLAKDQPVYRDLLAKLRDINLRLGENEAQLLRLQRQLKKSGGRPAKRTVKRLGALVGPMARDGLHAAADARALGLGVCAADLSGGAPLPGVGERST
jgi:hypothetical protein